jgi:hypothetical protein
MGGFRGAIMAPSNAGLSEPATFYADHRTMDNFQSYNHIADAIAKTNDALSAYDLLAERYATAKGTVAALTEDVAALHRNDAGKNVQSRAREFATVNGALSLAKGDLESLQDSLAAQKALTAAIGKMSASRLFEARDLLRMQRLKNVSAQLAADFDLTSLPVRLQEVAGTHKSIRAIGDLGVSQLFYQLQHDDSFTIGAVRHLGEHWSELRALVEAENVELSIAPISVPTIAKPKPAAVGNVLGTLAQAVAA